MGQKPSTLMGGSGFNQTNKKLPLFWWLVPKRQETNPNPEQPIKFQYKTRRKNDTFISNQISNNLVVKNGKNDGFKRVPMRTKSEPNLVPERRNRHRSRNKGRLRTEWKTETLQFGYEIQDVDAFLAKASLDKPANIPVVLAFPSVLYQTRIGGYQAEISLPLGMVVNAVFKNQHWLYVQTPHAEEGYVSYAACLPLGIIPPPDDDTPTPCWEKSTDVFPKPSGNMTDTEKLSCKSDCSGTTSSYRRPHTASSALLCGERSVDRLYLRATSEKRRNGVRRQTLLVICCDYKSVEKNSLAVYKGDVVFLLGTHVKGWFWVRNKEGAEGFIPAAVAGHGFL